MLYEDKQPASEPFLASRRCDNYKLITLVLVDALSLYKLFMSVNSDKLDRTQDVVAVQYYPNIQSIHTLMVRNNRYCAL